MSLHHQNSDAAKPGRVVVVGSSGFVGGAVVSLLEKRGIATVCVDRARADLLADDAPEKLSEIIQKGDHVVLAAAIAPCKTVQMLADNMTMVANIVAALERLDVAHVVNISSDAVYPDEPVPLHEGVPPSPETLHGAMHLAREVALAASVSAPLANLRPTLIYGLRDPHNSYGPNRFRRLAQSAEPITLFGQGEERRDHVCVDDVAEIVVKVLEHRSAGTLNIASGNVHSFADAARMAIAAAGTGVEIKSTPRVGEMPHKGYRPFDIAESAKAFPDFNFLQLPDGISLMATESEAAQTYG